MEFYGQRTISSFLEEQKNMHSPPRLSMNTHQGFYVHNSDEIPSSASTIQLSPPSPESPWKLTPIHSSPSQPLLYQCIASLQRREGNIFSMAFSRGVIYTGSQSSRVRLWRQPDCIERGFLKTSSGEIRAILACGNLLFTTHKDYKIRMWKVSVTDNFRPTKITSLPSNKYLARLFRRTNQQKHKDIISCIAYNSAEGLLYTGSWDKTVKVWEVCDKKCIDTFVAHEDNINAILVHQEHGSVFTCSSDGYIKIWRRVFGEHSHALTMTFKVQNAPVNALALSSASLHSCYLYSGSSDGLINVWENETVSRRFKHGGFLEGHQFAILCLVAIEKLVFSGSEDTTIRVWRREEGTGFSHTCLAVLDGHQGPVKCLAACLEMDKVVMGFLVYSTGLDQTLKVWRVKVFPDEKKASVEVRPPRLDLNVEEYEMSPVLSPSWVEKKLQENHLH